MKKIIYSFILIFSISLISSAKQISGCRVTCCKAANKNNNERKNNEVKREPSSLSLFFFNI